MTTQPPNKAHVTLNILLQGVSLAQIPSEDGSINPEVSVIIKTDEEDVELKIPGALVEIEEVETEIPTSEPKRKWIMQSIRGVNIRKEPSTDGGRDTVVKTLGRGAKVTAVDLFPPKDSYANLWIELDDGTFAAFDYASTRFFMVLEEIE